MIDTFETMNALGFVNLADTGLVIGDRVHGTGLLAGTLLMQDRAVGAGLGAQAAGFAFCEVDAHFGIAG